MMKVLKFALSLVVTLLLIYALNRSWLVGGNRLPPLGKFLDPFHGFWQNIESDYAAKPGTLVVTGLTDKVSIAFDSLAIPHIFAQNDEDLYFAQGYVTALHRLWQMEFQTHAAAGRVSEVIGAGKDGVFLNYDRGQRRIGMMFGARHSLEAMEADSTSRMMIHRYTEGINSYIASLEYDDLPFEYKLLDYQPEPWTPLKCALLLKNMALTLNMGDKDMQMSNSVALFGKELTDLLYPDVEGVTDPIVDTPGEWKFTPVKMDSFPVASPDSLIRIRKMPDADPTTGSNNWAVHGSKTATGAPILCGDPHLNLSLPSLWYALQLHGPGANTMGASLPGSPAIIIGFNDSIAWSVTNAQRDLVDWYRISFQDDNRDTYRLDDKWVPTQKTIEAIAVRDQPVFYDTVVYTHWGPIPYDRSYHAENNLHGYALRWIAHDTSNEVLTFYKLNRGRNHADYMAALDHYSSPAQNFAFASVGGDIAMRIQGKFPVRRAGEGRFVMDGSKTANGWHAFIPNDQNIQYKNPARGFVSSANQYPVDNTYPYYITGTSWEAYRNRRINKVLSTATPIQVSDMMKLQGDNYNLKAEESLPMLLSLLDTTRLTPEEKQAYRLVRKWNLQNDNDSEGASVFEAWWSNVMTLTWDEMDRKDVLLQTPTQFTTVKLLRENPQLTFFDIKSTPEKETAQDVVRKGFLLAVDDLQKWRHDHDQAASVPWADYKDSYVGHLLRLQPLSIPIRHGGGRGIVNAHSRTHGPSWRMIVSLEKSGVKTWATYPGGQSGNPGSPHYSDLLDRWVKDEYDQLLFMHSLGDAASQLESTVELNPAPVQ